jgi:cystathionine beta-lyase
MKFNFDQNINRRNSDSIKWNFFEEDVLPLWVADMDFLSPPPVIKALQDRVEHGVFGYSKTQQSTSVAIQGWLSRRHSWSISLEDIVVIPGVVQAFNVAASAFSRPGDSILIQTPAYRPFIELAENIHLEQIANPLISDSEGHYSLDNTAFKKAFRPNTRTFMLCNPHNPSGRVFTRSELEYMAECCLQNNTIICSDEIHSDVIYPGYAHLPIASLSPDIAQHSVTFLSATKTFNLAGLKSSAVIIPNPRLRKFFVDKLSGIVGSVNVLGEIAFSAAYNQGEQWLSDLLVYLGGNRTFLMDFVQNELPGIKLSLPEATYLGWLDCSQVDLADPATFFLERGRVALSAGSWFGDAYARYARINFGCPREILIEALERMRNALLAR